ncbi:MAG TPA: Gfo/Idh/MocA family oxidoreductase, partial [Phototrophicaceae bacterium]|nr:Gfo/Idh/MocA family oxidoreductase [Phototrophicaceae bacterium]
MTIRVGIVGTSGWTEFMYLPALQDHPHGKVVALCGRNVDHARKLADQWNVPLVFTDYNAMIDSGEIDTIIVSTPNVSHYPITMRALDKGLHVLCEKPLAMNYAEAREMADTAAAKGVIHMTPFTYRFLPLERYLKQQIDNGFIGKPYHLNLRYYSNYGRKQDYVWRLDADVAGSGALGDIGSHFLYLAYWYYGKIKRVSCQLQYVWDRPALNPEGKPYAKADDAALILLDFENSAQGSIHLSLISHEPAASGQSHHMEFHGSEGTLYAEMDFDKIQRVIGQSAWEPSLRELPIPDELWQGASQESVNETYKDVFRK